MLTQDRLKELLAYDPLTGEFTNRVRRGSMSPTGMLVGTPHSGGYLRTRIDGRDYLAHRLVWLYVHGTWPDEVDHADGVRNNNALVNLREATRAQNCQNTAMGRNNTSGVRGVSWSKKDCVWRAQISLGGKIKALGSFGDARSAEVAYLEAKAKMHKFQPTPRHLL